MANYTEFEAKFYPVNKVAYRKKLKKLGNELDKRLIKNADKLMEDKIITCKTKDQLELAMKEGKVGRVNWCSTNKDGIKCAENIEKKTGAEVRGTLANKKETPVGKCIVCGNIAREVVYIAKSY